MNSKTLYLLPLGAVAVLFFAAAKFLPPVATHAASIAAACGYTNQTLPLVAILLLGAAALGALAFGKSSEAVAALQRAASANAPWPQMRRHIAAACLLGVAVIALFPVWSTQNGYFGLRLSLMDAGRAPYRDFEFAYGYAVAYVPYGLHRLGLSVPAALIVTLCLASVAGVVSLAVIVRRCIARPALRVAMFWALAVCAALVDPGPSLNYNFGRYALPFALLALLTARAAMFGAARLFAVTAAFTLAVYLLSPEMALAFSFAVLAWLAVAGRFLPRWNIAAGALAVIVVGLGLWVAAPEMFTTFGAYAQAQTLMPVVPNPIMTLTVLAFVGIGALNFCVALTLWSGRTADGLQLSQPAACALMAAGLLPAVVGRAGPTITIAYGFVSLVMATGYLDALGARRAAVAVAAMFAAFVAYSAQFAVRLDAGQAVRLIEGDTRRHKGFADTRPAALAFLKAHYPGAYDPLGTLGPPTPGVTAVGYYPGWAGGDVATDAALARKAAELARAPYYIVPAQQDAALRLTGSLDRSLRNFAVTGLYPFALRAAPGAKPFGADFIAMLYRRCRPAATAPGIVVCRLN